MEAFKFSNQQYLTKDVAEIKERKEFQKVKKGRWYHFNRFYVVKSLDAFGLIRFNFFERLVFNLFKINCFKTAFAGKTIKGISTTMLMNLQELESNNVKSKEKGFKGNSIFVDITSEGGNAALNVLKSLEPNPKSCHLGLACFVNFSLAAASKSDKVILLDYDPVVIRFNRLARELLMTSSTPEEFKENLIQACQKDPEISSRNFYPKTENNLRGILDRDESFLAHDEDFKQIKKLAEEKQIHIYQGSIYDPTFIGKMAQLTKDEGYHFDSLFISNVYDWDADEKKRELLSKNIKTLCEDNTKIIEVVPFPKGHYNVNIVYYQDPESRQIYDPKIMRGEGNRKAAYPAAPLL